jgi:lipid II:glycine glycyltransferase (peptidoglycan interpeptide bridge formation enzyme)
MKSYFLPSVIFKKKWVWFEEPGNEVDADVVTFFSYADLDVPQYSKKEGWTTVIDLLKPQEEIWQAFRPGFIAEQIKKGERKGIQIRQDENWEGFKALYRSFREHKGIPKDDERLFEKHGVNFSAYINSELLASGVFICDERNIRAWALASKRLDGLDGKGKDLVGFANRMLLWEAIKFGKASGRHRFDFGGIAISDDGTVPPLTVFKEAFGGTRIKNYYYTKTNSPVLNMLSRIKKVLKGR